MTKKELLKKIVKITSYTVLTLLAIPLVLFLALKSPKVQTFVVHQITNILSEKFKTEISIESVDYAFFNKLRMNKVFVRDQKGDTLLYASKIYTSVRWVNLQNRTISIGTAELDNGKFFLKQDSTHTLNLKFILDAFASKDTTKAKPFTFRVRNLELNDFAFKYHKWGAPKIPYGMNYANLDIRNIRLNLRNIRIDGDKIKAKMAHLSATEKCGFVLNKLNADIDFSPREIKLSNAKVITPLTKLNTSHIIFRFNGFKDWLDYVHKVRMDVVFNNSLVDFRSIAYFAPTLLRWDLKGYVDGRVRGPVSALRSDNLEFRAGDSTYIALNFSIVGLPNAEQTIWRGNVEKVSSNGKELGQLVKTFVGTHGEQVANIIGKLGPLNLNAYFSGKFAAFTSSAEVTSAIGNISASLDTKESKGHTNGYKLQFTTKALHLGHLLDLNKFGTITTSFKSEGATTGQLIHSSESVAIVDELQFNGYTYKNLDLLIDRNGRQYDYELNSRSKDAELRLVGSYNFETKIPRTIASAKIDHINLHNLNFMDKDTISSIRGLMSVDFTGTKVDEMNGSFTVDHATLISHQKEFLLGRAEVNIQNSEQQRVLTLKSDFMDAMLKGNASLTKIKDGVDYFVKLYLPSLPYSRKISSIVPAEKVAAPATSPNRNRYLFDCKVKNAETLLSFFVPNLKVDKGTTLIGEVAPSLNKVDVRLKSGNIQIGSNQFKNINLQTFGSEDNLKASVACEEYINSNLSLKKVSYEAFTQNDKVNSTVSFNNTTRESKNEGTLRFITNFENKKPSRKIHFQTDFLKSTLTVNDIPWTIGNAIITLDSSTVAIEDFKLTNQQQKIAVAGKISENKDDQLHFIINNIDVQNFKTLFAKSGFDIQGYLNGVATLKNIYKSPMLFSNIKLNDAYINGRAVGSPELISSWDDVSKKISIFSSNYINDREIYKISGTITPDTKELDLDVKVDQLRAFLLEPFTAGIVSNLRGFISANLSIKGKTNSPIIEGKAYLNDVKAKVDFLNTTYGINAPVTITQNEIRIANDTLTDVNGQIALVDARVTHRNLKDFKFDINIQPQKLLALNTNPKLSNIFYGTAYASGLVKIQGDLQNLVMRISAQTEKNTKVVIPLNNRTQIQDQSFLTFVNPNSNEVDFKPEEKKTKFKPKSNLKIYLDLTVTPDAEAQILLDASMGGMAIKAQGNSVLSMEVDPSTNLFQIRGVYTIQKGNFKLSLLNLTSKDFSIDNGSTISWTGDPANASINVAATYKVRTSLAPLFAGTEQGSNQRYNIDCKTSLSGMLLNPTIKFDVKLPESDPATQTLVAAALNTESQMQKQFISLLMIGQFYPEQTSQNNNDVIANAGKGMASDLIFSQLTNIVSQISNDVDFGIKYTPATATTDQEYEVSFSKNLFNDWVTVNGVVDFSGNTKSTGQGVAGDYDIEVKLDKKDRLKFKMFSYQQQDNLLKLSNTKQGVGIFYQEQFNSFRDLFKRKKKKRKEVNPDSSSVNNSKEANKQPTLR